MNDRDAINQRVLNGMVLHVKAEEADRLNKLGVEAQLAYLLTNYTLDDLVEVFANPFDPKKRDSFALETIERFGAEMEPTAYPVECIEELTVMFQHVPEVSELLARLTAVLSVVDKITVECSLCHKPVPRRTAHMHQLKYVGDECCWDERLRTTE